MKILEKINKSLIGYFLAVGIISFLFMFVITCVQIGHDVQKRCEIAKTYYGGGCVDALMSQIADESRKNGKNDAIWALGQLGDEKALSFLKQYDNGQSLPDREPWNEGISQYELRKSIKLLEGGFNITAFVWRN